MALFKIEKGLAASLATARPTTNEGWCYFTKDDGKFYIDIETGNDLTKRVCLNANTADKLTCGNIGNSNTPVYFENGIPVVCTDLDVDMDEYLPLTAGEENKLTGPLGLTQDIMYGTILPENGFEGQLFFLEDESSGEYLPSGGVAGQALIKNSNAEGDASWQDIIALPDGGTAGQALIKNSTSDGDASWQDIVALPKGGDIGQALIKVSPEDGDAEWKEIVALPKGGAQGQILTKNSSTDGDAVWQNFPEADLSTSGIVTTNTQTFSGNKIFNGSVMVGSENTTKYVDFRVNRGDNGNFIFMAGESQFDGGSIGVANTEGIKNQMRMKNDYTEFTKYIKAPQVYGAVWNDYAEYRSQKEEVEPGYCVASADNGQVYKTTEKFQACDGIVSDTFGFAIGETDECKTPLAVAGRVLAYFHGNREDYHAGDTVCAGPNGKVCKMTREEIREWPDRIIGIVSEIPEYETWGTGNINVNGRIWIKVK